MTTPGAGFFARLLGWRGSRTGGGGAGVLRAVLMRLGRSIVAEPVGKFAADGVTAGLALPREEGGRLTGRGSGAGVGVLITAEERLLRVLTTGSGAFLGAA